MKLYEKDFPIILLLMNCIWILNNIPIIPHMIEEVPNFKAFIIPYLRCGAHRLIGIHEVSIFIYLNYFTCVMMVFWPCSQAIVHEARLEPIGGASCLHVDKAGKCYLMGSPNPANQYP